ncbi:hypothetical protein GCM10011390_06420 [Aureimonas endophytica]|uniref:Tetratricopeptide repeat protein n=1 Tax=Aureimonas endophytica TaxID=2027858 RepID=A0A916ZDP6_9HYPH|nr:hypothetical protein [Aureimonas endophytica]GGD90366.1 hypothetical protein GCM10011390_06420 [Aureimonas endophytica]
MRPSPRLVIAGLALLSLGAGLLLVPGTAERLTMLARDGRVASAAALGEAASNAGGAEPPVLARLFELDRSEGDPARAEARLLDFLRERPDDTAMLRKAAAFFGDSRNFPRQRDMLERLTAIDGTGSDFETLARLYRLDGRFADERRVLLTAPASALSPALRLRAAHLLSADGQDAEAARMLEGSPETSIEAEGEALSLYMRALVASGQAAKAAVIGVDRVADGLSVGEQAQFVLALALAGADAEALRLATAPRPDGGDASAIAWMLGERGRFDLATRLLEAGLGDADRRGLRKAMRLYADLALATNHLGCAVAEVRRLASGSAASPQRAAALAAALFERRGYGVIAPVRPWLTPSILREEPLFAARLARLEHDPAAARRFLLQAGEDEDEPAARQAAFEALDPVEAKTGTEMRRTPRPSDPPKHPSLIRAADPDEEAKS